MSFRKTKAEQSTGDGEPRSLPPLVDAGLRKLPFRELDWRSFEQLTCELMQPGPTDRHDRAALMAGGRDMGADIHLTLKAQLIGIVQCKQTERAMTLSGALAEVAKFLLWAEIDPRLLPSPDDFTYWLALARDPDGGTRRFFSELPAWIADNRQKAERAVARARQDYSGFADLDLDEVQPRVVDRMMRLRYALLGPEALAQRVKEPARLQAYFQLRPVADLDELAAQFAAAGMNGASGARDLTKRRARACITAVGKYMVDRFAFRGLYKPDRTIARAALDAEWQRFFASSKMIFPVIGMSGVGKTSALAHLLATKKSAGPPILLVQASEIRAHHRSIVDLIEDLPWPAELGAPSFVLERIEGLQVLKSAIVLLDGLNEADPVFLRTSWIPNTLDWLQRSGARLVVTCRPERWTVLKDAFPKQLLHRLPGEAPALGTASTEEGDFFRLKDFTGSEAEDAARTYGIEGAVTNISHPLCWRSPPSWARTARTG